MIPWHPRRTRKATVFLGLALVTASLHLPQSRHANSPREAPPPTSADPDAQLEWLNERAVAWFGEQSGNGFARMPAHDHSDLPEALRIASPAAFPGKGIRSIWALLQESFNRGQASSERGFQVEAFELVSLLVHDEPAVYVEEVPPKMIKMRSTPTRPLDDFEKLGLQHLRQDQATFITRSGESIRMLGAVRAKVDCTKCHQCSPGDLLGAFSYTLRAR